MASPRSVLTTAGTILPGYTYYIPSRVRRQWVGLTFCLQEPRTRASNLGDSSTRSVYWQVVCRARFRRTGRGIASAGNPGYPSKSGGRR